jgi:hypothetical protein
LMIGVGGEFGIVIVIVKGEWGVGIGPTKEMWDVDSGIGLIWRMEWGKEKCVDMCSWELSDLKPESMNLWIKSGLSAE